MPTDTQPRIPLYIVTSENWTHYDYILFADEDLKDSFSDFWREEIENGGSFESFEERFYDDNDEVEDYYPEFNLCIDTHGCIYSYTDDGSAEFLAEGDDARKLAEYLMSYKRTQ